MSIETGYFPTAKDNCQGCGLLKSGNFKVSGYAFETISICGNCLNKIVTNGKFLLESFLAEWRKGGK